MATTRTTKKRPTKRRHATLAPLPTSNAKTAYQLINDVKRAIRDEPKRIYMPTYHQKHHPRDGGPACGTEGCFAGWIAILAGAKPGGDDEIASRLLGISHYSSAGISPIFKFDSDGRTSHVFGSAPMIVEPFGTTAYAKAVIKQHITPFQQQNAAPLKARKLKRVKGRLQPVTP